MIKIHFQRSLHLLTSTLAVTAQRLPFIKHFGALFSSPVSLRIATPLTVSFAGTHSLSGQSVVVEPVGTFTDSAEGKVEEAFNWAFTITDGHNPGSCTVTGLPAGLEHGFDSGTRLGFISGTPIESGSFTAIVTMWRRPNLQGEATPSYSLAINIEGSSDPDPDPFTVWRGLHWNGEEAANDEVSGPNIDSDEDGIPNLLEFFFDLHPLQKEVDPGRIAVDPEDADKLLYTLPLNPNAGSLTTQFQESNSLKESEWEDITPNADYEVLTSNESIQLRFPKDSQGKFIRLIVSL